MINPVVKEHASRLYIKDGWTLERIAEHLKISNHTLRLWKDKGGWDVLRKEFLDTSQNFTAEITAFAMQLALDVKAAYAVDKKIDVKTANILFDLLARVKDIIVLDTERTKTKKQAETEDLPPEVLIIPRVQEALMVIDEEVKKYEKRVANASNPK